MERTKSTKTKLGEGYLMGDGQGHNWSLDQLQTVNIPLHVLPFRFARREQISNVVLVSEKQRGSVSSARDASERERNRVRERRNTNKICDMAVPLKLGAGHSSCFGTGGWVWYPACCPDDVAVQGQDSGSLEKLCKSLTCRLENDARYDEMGVTYMFQTQRVRQTRPRTGCISPNAKPHCRQAPEKQCRAIHENEYMMLL